MKFEFNESVASNVLSVIASNILQMDGEATSFEQQAAENEQLASQKEAEANSEEASIHHYKTETRTRTVTDDDGNTTTEEYDVSVIDEEADAASLARAVALRAEAAALKAIASTLRGVAASLRLTSSATGVQQQQFNQAITTTQLAIATTNLLLKEGMNIIGQVKSAFNVPQTENKVEWAKNVGSNLLKIVGVDLSDGLNDEIYNAIGVATQLGVIAGTVALNSAVSVIGTKMGVGILGNLGRQALKIESQNIKDKYLNQTAAKVAQNAIASALTLHGINALPTVEKNFSISAATLNGTEKISQMTFEEAKTEAKEKYAKYVAKLDCYTDEQKQDLINKYNKQIDKAVVLSDEDSFKQLGKYNEGIVAYNNGAQDRVYIREGYANDPSVIIHEVGGHGTGSMASEAGYYYTNPETGEDVLYTGKYEDSPYKLSWKGNYSGIDEAATEYFARKINGEKWEECAYNSSTDALQKITESMTKYAGINGEELLMQTYTGEDKDLFKNVYNKISGSNGAYDALNAMMRDSNTGNKMGGSQALYYETRFFEIDCQNAK